MSTGKPSVGMTLGQARLAEGTIIGLSVLALAAIFQPFSMTLFSAGCILVVVAGLAFNLVPFCEPGRPARDLLRAALIVAAVFVVVLALALLSASLYGVYLEARRPG
jgi:hypothetical protein